MFILKHEGLNAILKPLPHCQEGKCGGKILKHLLMHLFVGLKVNKLYEVENILESVYKICKCRIYTPPGYSNPKS